MDPIFVDGLPARITREDFRRYHLQAFPALADEGDEVIDDAIEAAYAMFTGIATLWDWQPKPVWYEKTTLCYRLLAAWYLMDVYPTLAAGGGTASMGGIPIKRKKIGGVDITRADDSAGSGNKDYTDLLDGLKSNAFGYKAYFMIKAAGKRVLLRNRRYA
jgi:hypothetical protein